ncbi:hypothetical protein ACHAO4_001563 [Trichoderma viride]
MVTEQNQNSGDDMYMTDISDEATLQPYPESQAVSDPNWALMAYNLRIIMENSPLDTYKNIEYYTKETQVRTTRDQVETHFSAALKARVCSGGTEISPKRTKHYRCSRHRMFRYAC